MGLFGGTQIETNKGNLVRNVIVWIAFNRTTDSNKIEVIVLDDQRSRELRRIQTTGLAVYLDDSGAGENTLRRLALFVYLDHPTKNDVTSGKKVS